MAAYKDLVGQKITKVTSNPSEPKTGQMWYNSTDGKLRGLGILNAWASSGSLISARGFVSHTGTQTASLLAGGLSPAPSYFSASEEYNGSGWSTGGSLPAGTYALSSAGTQTAALVFGGANSSDTKQSTTYTYNGTSFSTTPNSLNTARDQLSGGGTQTSALAVGGRVTSAVVTNMEEWNGSSWTNLTALPEKRGYTHANGPETAFFMASGALGDNAGSPYTSATLNYDGSSISTGENVNTARSAGGAAGDSANAIFYGGDVSGTSQTKTEKYDGTSWSEVADMAVAKRGSGAGAGTSNAAALSAGAYGPPASASTEEFTSSTNTITAAAWSSGGTYPYAAANAASLGPATAMLTCGGNNSGPTKQTTVNLYNGTTYSAETGIPAATNGMGSGKGGTETAGLIFGGSAPGGNTTTTILYNGSSWTSGGALSTARRNLGGLGISTAALAFGGQEPSYSTATEEYGGSSWTSGGALPAARRNPTGVGSQTAGLVLGGQSPPGAGINTSFTYNGTSYSGGPSMINSRSDGASSGPNSSNTSALVYGGSAGAPPYTVILPTESYDGSAFSTAPSLSTGRDGDGSGSSASEGVQVAGYVPSGSYLSSTEQFTPETSTANITDFTTS